MKNINKEFLEKLILKSLMNNSGFMSRISDKLTDNLFSVSSYNTISKFYKSFWNEHQKLPSNVELKLYCSNSDLFLAFKDVYNDINSIDINEINEDILYKYTESFLKERLAILSLNEIVDNFQHGKIEPEKLVSKFEKIAGISLLFENGFDIHNDLNRYVESLLENKHRLPTGFAELDKHINGGIPINGKCLSIVTAPTNVGKSIMLGNIAVNVARSGKNVLIISLEMSEEVYASRVYSAMYDLPINSLPLMTEELSKEIQAHPEYGKIIIKEFPPSTMTVEHIDSYIDTLIKNGYHFDLICVDYLTLLHAPGADNSNEAGKHNTRKLRALTYKYEVPIWTACQINRDGMKENTPEIHHIAESIAIAADADLIVSLYQQPEDVDTDIMRLSFLKSRLGDKGFSINLLFNKKYLRFEDIGNTASTNISEEDKNMIKTIENVLSLDEIIENAS